MRIIKLKKIISYVDDEGLYDELPNDANIVYQGFEITIDSVKKEKLALFTRMFFETLSKTEYENIYDNIHKVKVKNKIRSFFNKYLLKFTFLFFGIFFNNFFLIMNIPAIVKLLEIIFFLCGL